MMKIWIALLALTLVAGAVEAKDRSVGDRWEKSLLDAKRKGSLPGPKPGQKCLWSKRLGACLWYTPGKW